MATNHSREMECDVEIACLRDGTILGLRGHIYGDMGAYMRTNGGVVPAKAGAVPARAVPHPRRRDHGRDAGHQQDAGRHHAGAGPVRGQLLPRAAARHGGARPRARPDGVPPQEPDHARPNCRSTAASWCPTRARPSSTPATITSTFERALDRDRLGGEEVAAGAADRRPLPRARRRAVHRERRLRQGELPARDRSRRHGHRLCRLGGERAGARDHAGAGRRRNPEAAVRPHPHPARLDHLSARGLRHVRVALDGGRRLGGGGRLQQSHRRGRGRGAPSASACPTSRSSSPTAW